MERAQDVRLGEHEGSSVSLASLSAPIKARKAYERGEALMPKRKWAEAEKHFKERLTFTLLTRWRGANWVRPWSSKTG